MNNKLEIFLAPILSILGIILIYESIYIYSGLEALVLMIIGFISIVSAWVIYGFFIKGDTDD